MTVERVAFVNAKGGVGLRGDGARAHNGRRLDNAAVRITRAMRVWNEVDATIAGFVEFSAIQAQRIHDRHNRWMLYRGEPNTVRHGGRVEVGNALGWRDDVWSVGDVGQMVAPDVASIFGPPIDLHFPWADLTHRETGARVIACVPHFPAGKRPLILREKRRCGRVVADFAAAQTVPVLALGDLNSGALTHVGRWPGHRFGPDHIRIHGDGATLGPLTTHPEMYLAVTDHRAGLSADLTLTNAPTVCPTCGRPLEVAA